MRARALLKTAAEGAVERRLVPILDVATQLDAAIELYERSGWVRVGTERMRLSSGEVLTEYVYRAPDSLRPSER